MNSFEFLYLVVAIIVAGIYIWSVATKSGRKFFEPMDLSKYD